MMTKLPASIRLRLCVISLGITVVFSFVVVVIANHVDLMVYGYLGTLFILHGTEVYGAKRN